MSFHVDSPVTFVLWQTYLLVDQTKHASSMASPKVPCTHEVQLPYHTLPVCNSNNQKCVISPLWLGW